MVFSIGLTGNIASGKSTVAKLFTDLGVKVISADAISKQLTVKDTDAYHQIIKHFGEQLLLENKELDRRSLREIIFSNPRERLWLENLLHPLIRQTIEQQIKEAHAPYCLVEIPLLVDKTNYSFLNKILLITSPIDMQLSRIMDRDLCSEQQAMAIISTQPELQLRLQHADHVIVNDSDLTHLKKSVEELHHLFLKDSM